MPPFANYPESGGYARLSRGAGVIGLLLAGFVALLLFALPAAAQEFQPSYSGFSDSSTAFPYGSALDGLGVVVSAGHGWEGAADGSYQRTMYKFNGCGTCEGIVEDLYNAELVTDHLIPMLRQAGARVYMVRQPDRTRMSVQVDDGELGYSETGTWADGANIELGWQSDYRTHSATYSGTASWSLDVPQEGDYWVQARWAAGANRCATVRYTVEHAGGAAEFLVNQQADGSMWVHLGRLHFLAGTATVTIDVPEGGSCYLIADAVSLGGGVDSYSGKAWWQVGALQWLDATGPAAMSTFNDVTVRPGLANAVGADYFLSIHGDASSDETVSGTSTYRYNCGSGVWWESMDPATCDLPDGSAAIQYSIQDRLVADLRAQWDAAWVNRGKLVGDYGELRPLDGIPGVIVETAFFNNLAAPGGMLMSDNQSMHTPVFRHLAAQAVVRGLISAVDPTAVFPPQAPTHVVLRDAGGALRASWHPVTGAAGYRVYVAVDGRGYDGGRLTTSAWLDLPDIDDGMVALVRVTALNAGGESGPSDAVCASRLSDAPAGIIVVNAFDRLDAWVREDFNHRDYSFEHGMALAAAGFAFDGVSDEAVTAGDVSLPDYEMADWILGRESTAAETFDATAQSIVMDYLSAGGCVIASGTEIAWDLGNTGTTADRQFLADAFGAAYAADDAGARNVSANLSGPLAGLASFAFDDGTSGTYDARYPDVFTAGRGDPALTYSTGGIAAVATTGPSGRSFLAGFPIETVVGVGPRNALMAALVSFCGVGGVIQADDPDMADDPVVSDPGGEGGITVDDVVEPSDVVVEISDAAVAWDSATDDPGSLADAHGLPDLATDPAMPFDTVGDRLVVTDASTDIHWLTDLPAGADGVVESSGDGGCSAGASGGGPFSTVLLLLLFLISLMCIVRSCKQDQAL